MSRHLTPFLLSVAFAAGCGGAAGPSVRLDVLSPHRDEVRTEVAAGFRDWFAARTDGRLVALESALQAQLQHSDAGRQGVNDALAALAADWRPEDLGDVDAARRAWEARPGPDSAAALLDAVRRFRAAPPAVNVVWQDVGGGSSQIEKYIRAQFGVSPDGINVDLLFGGGSDVHGRLAHDGMLAPCPVPRGLLEGRIPKELNGVPLYDPQGRWYGPILSSFGILVNKRVCERRGVAVPETWADLGRPDLFRWVGAGDPRMTGSLHLVYEIILQEEGWDAGSGLLLRLGANTHSFIRDSGTLTRLVTRGEVAAAGNVDANAFGAVARDPEGMTYRLPPGGTVINPDPVAVLRGAPHPGLARAFVEYTLSDAGQRLFMLRPGLPGGPRRYPVGRLAVVEAIYKEIPPADRAVGDVDPFAFARRKDRFRYSPEVGGRRWDALNDLFGAVVVDAHPDLSAAWGAVLRLPADSTQRQALEGRLFAPPCPEAELDEQGARVRAGDTRGRALTVNRWGEAARERYRAVRREAWAARGPG
jgi:ABC-type Fe3+ transport system substrate-binding protein